MPFVFFASKGWCFQMSFSATGCCAVRIRAQEETEYRTWTHPGNDDLKPLA